MVWPDFEKPTRPIHAGPSWLKPDFNSTYIIRALWTTVPMAALARDGHFSFQLFDGGTLQTRNVHLRDAQPLGDLCLGQLVDEAQVHDPSLARRQVAHRLVDQI